LPTGAVGQSDFVGLLLREQAPPLRRVGRQDN